MIQALRTLTIRITEHSCQSAKDRPTAVHHNHLIRDTHTQTDTIVCHIMIFM